MPLSLKGAAKMANTWTTLLDAVYPIGSVYSAYTSTSPATRFGGTWSAITERFPYYNAGTDIGGSNTHTLTIDEMPEHSHKNPITVWYGGDAATYRNLYATNSELWSEGDWNCATAKTGGGEAHNNMPAYQTLYAWRRTA